VKQIYSFFLPVKLVEALDALPGKRSKQLMEAINSHVQSNGGSNWATEQMQEAEAVQERARLLLDHTEELLASPPKFEVTGGFFIPTVCEELGIPWEEVEAFDDGTTVWVDGRHFGTAQSARLLIQEFKCRAEPPAEIDIEEYERKLLARLEVKP
jgi:hypothetical protein